VTSNDDVHGYAETEDGHEFPFVYVCDKKKLLACLPRLEDMGLPRWSDSQQVLASLRVEGVRLLHIPRPDPQPGAAR
jgi:hypothetical protein